MSVYVTSDPHIGHVNMAIKRGFCNVLAHDAAIIASIKATMTKRDKLFILGDLSMHKGNYDWLYGIPGSKHIILGNHDDPKHVPMLAEMSLRDSIKVSAYHFDRKRKVILSHIPIHPCEIDRFKKNIHGHMHEKTIPDDRYVNVCLEQTDYKPVLLDSLC